MLKLVHKLCHKVLSPTETMSCAGVNLANVTSGASMQNGAHVTV